jgi:tetratricopeptide (TPR) repeat protein
MGALLEIFGRALTVDTTDLIWHWLNNTKLPSDSNQSTQHEQLSRIIGLIGDTKLNVVQDQLKLYLFDNPSCIYGRMAAALICLHKNQLNEAIEELNSVYLKMPNNTTALYALGHCYERLGKESQAVEFYQDCLKFKNYLQFPCQRLAAIYFKNGQLEKTIQQYEQLHEQYPDDISTLITLGNLYIASTRYAEAIEAFNTAILVHPDIFLPENDDIEQLIQAGQFHTALQQLEDLSDQHFDRPELILRQADVLSMIGADGEAVSLYQHALSICPDFLEATVKLGKQYLRMEAEHLAAQQFNRAVEINDKIVDAYIGVAKAQKLTGFLSEALSTLSLAAAIQPNSSFLFAETSKLLFKNSFSDAFSCSIDTNELIESVIKSHQQQILNQPHNSDLYYRLGILMMGVGLINNAIEYFRLTLKINPTYDRAKNKLAICLLESDDKNSSLDLLNAPDYLDKDTLSLHYKTALLYCDKLKFASSLFNLARYMEDNFSASDSTVNISVVLQNLGLLDRVAAMWENLSETASQAIHRKNV